MPLTDATASGEACKCGVLSLVNMVFSYVFTFLYFVFTKSSIIKRSIRAPSPVTAFFSCGSTGYFFAFIKSTLVVHGDLFCSAATSEPPIPFCLAFSHSSLVL